MSYIDEQDTKLLESKLFILSYNIDIPDASIEDCWLWNKNVGRDGYGKVTLGKDGNGKQRTINAHRLCYLLFVGPIPEGLSCLHTCDNRRCCNPAHLWIGTQKDNVHDMYSKGRENRRVGYKHSEETRGKISEARRRENGTL